MTLAGLGQRARAPVRALAVSPAIDDPYRWAAPGSLEECVAAVDVARAWLTRRGDELTVRQTAHASTALVTITRYLGHVQAQTTGIPALGDLAGTAARPWRRVLEHAGELRSPAPDSANTSTLTTSLTGVARWMREQLRPAGRWAEPAPWAGDDATRSAWHTATAQIISRMPDLADQLHNAILRTHNRGGVLVATGHLTRKPGQLIWTPQWVTAPVEHPILRKTLGALRKAATTTRDFANRANVPERPGIKAAAAAGGLTGPARLAGQWYPQNPTEPVRQTNNTHSRAAQQQTAPQVRRR